MIKLITHTDLDGVGASIVLQSLHPSIVDVSYVNNHQVDDKIYEVLEEHEKYSEIFIVDVTPTELTTVYDLNDIGDKVILIDHHKTAKWICDSNFFDYCEIETEKYAINQCGTSLLYFYLVDRFGFEFLPNDSEETLDNLIDFQNYVRLWDTWDWRNDLTIPKEIRIIAKHLNSLLYLTSIGEFVSGMLKKIQYNLPLLDEKDRMIVDFDRENYQNYYDKKIKDVFYYRVDGLLGGFIIADKYQSELGNDICEAIPELDFVGMINQHSISFRTAKSHIDVGSLAKKYGGGGHKPASGMPLGEGLIANLLDSAFNIK